MKMNIILPILVRSIIGVIFLIGAYLKLYPIVTMELLIMKIGFANWFWAPILVRLLIGIELSVGFLLISNFYIKKTMFFTLFILVFFTVFLFYLKSVAGANVNCGCFGEIIQMNPNQSILKNIGLIVLILILYFKRNFNEYVLKHKKYYLILIVFVGMSLPFILNAMTLSWHESNYVVEEGMFVNSPILDTLSFDNTKVDVLKDKKIVVFLSLSCKSCGYAASKLAITKKKNPNFPLYFIYLDYMIDDKILKDFFDKTGANIVPYTFLAPRDFYSISSNTIPFIMALESGEIKILSNYGDLYVGRLIEFWKN